MRGDLDVGARQGVTHLPLVLVVAQLLPEDPEPGQALDQVLLVRRRQALDALAAAPLERVVDRVLHRDAVLLGDRDAVVL
jgi:hypothetical protein